MWGGIRVDFDGGCWKTCNQGGRKQGCRMSEKEDVAASASPVSLPSCHSKEIRFLEMV